ncbi:cysteine--tRNA ligase [Candidatus Kaiserbacteria bacterium]|nr:cysteine--tRNA ligase [Candidatus Kaiserbacteria bacterium]
MGAFLEFLASMYALAIDPLGAWGQARTESEYHARRLRFFNTLTGKKEAFSSLEKNVVKMYNCGPTVYGLQHIGNLSMFVFVDILRRTLEYNNLHVKQVINFTDVGHLSSDADEGEDKMVKGLTRDGLALTLDNMRALGKKYADLFLADLSTLNINTKGTAFPRASDYIPQQIEMVTALEQKGFAYKGESGVYFDTSKFSEYGALGNIDLRGIREGARVSASSEKRSPTDFLLWKLSGKDGLGWESPWGKGYPGWHIECSAMSRDILGDQIDIHTGGIEHIPIHHNNEIAQSESATGKKPFSRFWLHRAHLQIEGGKIAKSTGNTVFLSEIIDRGFPALALRYLLLGAHYRTPASFTWEGMKAAQTSLYRLYNAYDTFKHADTSGGESASGYRARFIERINDDLDTPGALAAVWEMVRDEKISAAEKKDALESFDSVLGLGIAEGANSQSVALESMPEQVRALITAREDARKTKDWSRADELRVKIDAAGFAVKDSEKGPIVTKK